MLNEKRAGSPIERKKKKNTISMKELMKIILNEKDGKNKY